MTASLATVAYIGATILFGVLASLFRGGGAPEQVRPPAGANPLPADSDQHPR